jgi:2-oxoglutarate dehydrogenase E2 component (dihydrolipoamide succinyltransferase)
MTVELTVPEVGESITEVLVVEWLKKPGDAIQRDEPVAVIETDKATLEIPAPQAGTLGKILKQKDEWAKVGEAIALIEDGDGAAAASPPSGKAAAASEASTRPAQKTAPPKKSAPAKASTASKSPGSEDQPHIMPAAARLLAENDLEAGQVGGTGPGGRILKEDVQRHLDAAPGASRVGASRSEDTDDADEPPDTSHLAGREIESIPMSPLRRAVARRLVEAQQNAALLTTFNEIDMSEVKSLRKQHGEAFEKRYGVRLGFVSFFVKASIEALKTVPELNSQIAEKNIVYHHYYDIGIAVGGGKGLVVPVLRNAERKSFAEIEAEIADLAQRAKANKIELAELEGGTFTISNGGVYGSLLSTPIVNPPQSGVLGLHAIQDRPVVRGGEIVIRPMMYVALTYDHRVVDGREAVTFLRRIKDLMENPARMLLEI